MTGRRPPEILAGKRLDSRYLETEAPLMHIEPRGSALRTRAGILLLPGGVAMAQVNVPARLRSAFQLTAHSTSTFARCGLQLTSGASTLEEQLASGQLSSKLQVMAHNWSRFPILLRRGDPCRLLDFAQFLASEKAELGSEPATTPVPLGIELRAGDHFLDVDESKLPAISTRGKNYRFIDPRARNIYELFVERPLTRLRVSNGDLLVVSTRPRVSIPINAVGIARSARDDLLHTSAVLFHPGWSGTPALEFLATREAEIRPGQHLAWLSGHRLAEPVAGYVSRYHGQETPRPRSRK